MGGTCVQSDAQSQRLAGSMMDAEVADVAQQMQRQRRDLAGVQVTVAQRQPADDHVRVADRLHLVDVVALDDRVEQRVQVVQHVHHLQFTPRFTGRPLVKRFALCYRTVVLSVCAVSKSK